MLPFSGMPYGPAPAWCFPIFEFSMYLLFVACLIYAIKQGPRDVLYLLGGLAFGLMLEYMEVMLSNYTYGRFTAMLGKAPRDIPFCIGMGWGIIMYTARLFSDRLGLTLLACAALDTLLALNIDLSMDTVAYRLHMWHWDWSGTKLNPLTAQWFGIPYGNFIGWQTVVFCYSAFSRVFEKRIMKHKASILKFSLIGILALFCSLFVLYTTETYLFPFLQKLNILSVHRFIAITILLIVLTFLGRHSRSFYAGKIPGIAWIVPGWFHFSFFSCFFIVGFYTENKWMTIAACVNLFIGIAIHILPVSLKGGQSLGKKESQKEIYSSK
ncbi:MAG TPA: carotenoid biosynthesis protein [Mucilaginibacter sp.]